MPSYSLTARYWRRMVVRACWLVFVLVASGCKEVVLPDGEQELLMLMDSEDLEIAVRATQRLDRLYGQDGLLKAVRGGGVSARTWAAASLQGYPSAKSKAALLKSLADPEAAVRSKAVIALRAMCDRSCAEQIEPLTEDSDETVREMARATLMMLR